MAKIQRHAVVPYSSKLMFELVDDIQRYPEFLKWCHTTTVHTRSDNEVTATLDLSQGPLHKSFTTKNELFPYQKIAMHLVNGPFKKLEGVWEFIDVEKTQCRVSLDLEFEFSQGFLSLLLEPIFGQIADRLVDHFCERAKALYGARSS